MQRGAVHRGEAAGPARRRRTQRLHPGLHVARCDRAGHRDGARAGWGAADIAGKTGTTNEAADTWFNGYNDALVASVWVGFGDYRPIGRREYGSTTPLSVWMEFMGAALDGLPERLRTRPEGVVSVKIDPATGLAARPDQADALFEYFLEEDAPFAAEERWAGGPCPGCHARRNLLSTVRRAVAERAVPIRRS